MRLLHARLLLDLLLARVELELDARLRRRLLVQLLRVALLEPVELRLYLLDAELERLIGLIALGQGALHVLLLAPHLALEGLLHLLPFGTQLGARVGNLALEAFFLGNHLVLELTAARLRLLQLAAEPALLSLVHLLALAQLGAQVA